MVNTDFTGKVVLITGSSSGIGANAAIEFARRGAQVVVTGRNGQRIVDVAKLCLGASPKQLQPLQVVADLSKDEDVAMMIATIISAFQRIDVLINNAGVLSMTNIFDPNFMESFDNVHRTNLRSVLLVTHLAVPYLVKSKGNIINVSSIASTMPSTELIAYGSTKASLDLTTKDLTLSLSPLGVRVNTINPGLIKTSMTAHLGTDAYEKQYPIGRIGEVSDTTAAMLYLASDSASFISGASLVVDGGFSCTGTCTNVLE